MRIDRPQFADYVAFFETDASWVDPKGWFYGTRFAVQRGEGLLVVKLAPDELEFSLEWMQRGVMRLKFESVMVSGWELVSEDGREYLQLDYKADRVKSLTLQVKPEIQIDFCMNW